MYTQALNPEEIEEVREMVDDYLERHEDAFDEFDNPDDIYSELVEQLDGLEVGAPHSILCKIDIVYPSRLLLLLEKFFLSLVQQLNSLEVCRKLFFHAWKR